MTQLSGGSAQFTVTGEHRRREGPPTRIARTKVGDWSGGHGPLQARAVHGSLGAALHAQLGEQR